MEYFFAIVAAQVATVAFVLWPVFRIVRKVGYGRRYAWILCIVCAGCSFAISGLNVAGTWSGWLDGLNILSWPGAYVLVALAQFLLSPFVACVIPLIYFTFRKWPLEGRGKEADIFG